MFDIIPINGETWLVCGGRSFDDVEMFDSAMGNLIRAYGIPSRVVQGGAAGADQLARNWADFKSIDCITVMAEWETEGKKAGPLRNQKMLDKYKPSLVVAFPGGRGTADMKRRAEHSEIKVAEVKVK